ncbi:aspartate aminotransferase family protein [Microbacterium sp. NPDC090218]
MTTTPWQESKAAWERTKLSIPGGVSTGLRASMPPHPLFFAGGKGPRLIDIDGNTYIDYVLGWGPVILGHGNAHLGEAVAKQLPLGATYGAGHLLEAEVAEKVISRIPGMEQVLWSNTGTEAVQVALRLARGATGRNRFVKFGGHYHGWSDPMLVGYRPDSSGDLALGSSGQNPSVLDDVEILPWGDLESVRQALRAPGADIAAIILEPVLCNSGVIEPPIGFLKGLRDLADETGTILIFDEVITGFRIASGGAVERYGVVPDLVILAKAIAGGYPLSAVAGKARVLKQTTSGVVHAGTYNGNPISLAAAGATLDELAVTGTYERLEGMGLALATGLRSAFREHGIPVTINQVGPVVQCMPGTLDAATFADFLAQDLDMYNRFLVEMLKRGVFALPGGRWYISTAHTPADIAETVNVAADSLAAIAH